jgi:hypothetical protein
MCVMGTAWASVPQGVVPPGDAFVLPERAALPGAPQIFEHGHSAGPDETVFVVGTNLTKQVSVWGVQPGAPDGGPVQARVQWTSDAYLAFTVPQGASDGPFVVTVKNDAGDSAPFVVNAPEPWWCAPAAVAPGAPIRVFGRNLAGRPDGGRAHLWLCGGKTPGRWLDVTSTDAYAVAATLPADLAAGDYELWVHGGCGGDYGWGGPVRVAVRASERPSREKTLRPGDGDAQAIQKALDAMEKRGGGTVRLAEGAFAFTGTLRIPAQVTLSGAGRDKTTLTLKTSPAGSFARFHTSGWGVAPEAIHSQCDAMSYEITVPKTGFWRIWVRYGTDMSPWKQSGVSGNTAIQFDGGVLRTLEDLPNTGGFGVYRWSQSAAMELQAGRHTMTWRNVKGGGLSLDAFVLTLNPLDEPTDKPWPVSSSDRIVIQAEDCATFESKQGHLPGTDRAAVWLSGDGASLEDLTVRGNAQVNQGVAIQAEKKLDWISGCGIRRVRIADCEGKQAENCGVIVRRLRGGAVCDSELWGRAPLFLSGVRESCFASNRLVSVTRYGGNAEAAILGRCEPVERCVIEGNVVAAPPGAEAGGPTARRLVWLSTGHGSVVHNWIAHNGVEAAGAAGQARFGGVAGTDQNVGETILFEGNHRTMYFGPLDWADAQSVSLPRTCPATPDARLGSVKRAQLAYDEAGRETPFWPPSVDDGSEEPPLGEYYVTVFAGVGQGQTRRVVARTGERLLLDRPWRVAPQPGSVVAVGTMFYQNLIVGNHTPDGMSGIQLWISCVENVVARNTIERQRKQGLFFYANGTTLATSMPRTWNRGLSPLFWNVAEGNRAEECSDGLLISSGDGAGLPIEFPRALGNVVRHNSFIRSRGDGVLLQGGRGKDDAADRSASVVGTIAEFNVVRDARIGYRAGGSSDWVVWRRNHAYFWYPVDLSVATPVAFQIDQPATRFAWEENTVEGKTGNEDRSAIGLKKSWEK